MSKKIGLALGGGGARGVCHIGVIKALEEAGIKPDFISGCSMGSVVGACYAKGMPTDEMMEIVSKLSALKLIDLTVAPITKLGLLQGNKMNRLLKQHIGDIQFSDLNIPFTCVATDLYKGEIVTLSDGSVSRAVRASSSIPIIFPPVKYPNQLLVDGGVLCRVPVNQCWAMGADVVIAVDALVNTRDEVNELKNIFNIVTRTFDVVDHSLTTANRQLNKHKHELWIEPEIAGMSQYVPKDFDKAYDGGYQATKAKMNAIKRLIKD